MATEVYEDALELEIGLIEAENLSPEGGDAHRRSYPYPVLRPVVGRSIPRTFPVVVLENAYLRATFVPALGGRLLRLYDKGIGQEVLPTADKIDPIAGGPRGAILTCGIQALVGENHRLDSLADASFSLDLPSDDEAIGVWFFGFERELSYHAHWTLPPDRAELLLEVRTLNRAFRSLPYNGGIALLLGGGEVGRIDGGFVWDGGLTVFPEEAPFDAASFDGELRLARFPTAANYHLGPRQVDTWSIRFGLAGGIGAPTIAFREAVAHFDRESLALRSASKLLRHKVLILTEAGQTLEAWVDLYPEQPHRMPLEGLASPAVAVALQDPGKQVLFQGTTSDRPAPFTTWEATVPGDVALLLGRRPVGDLSEFSDEALLRANAHVELRAAALVRRAMRRLATGDYSEAAELLESALLYNADDPLAWWLRATALRRAGLNEDDQPEMLNAHYLAPLEPALRAEGFLSQPMEPGKEASLLLKPLAGQPGAFLEVACLLIDAGLLEDATRWIDEALRHADLAMLRYLLAYAYVTRSKMHVEAADQLAAAARLPEGPPYPYRPIEIAAIRGLHQAFPKDTRMASLASLVKAMA